MSCIIDRDKKKYENMVYPPEKCKKTQIPRHANEAKKPRRIPPTRVDLVATKIKQRKELPTTTNLPRKLHNPSRVISRCLILANITFYLAVGSINELRERNVHVF